MSAASESVDATQSTPSTTPAVGAEQSAGGSAAVPIGSPEAPTATESAAPAAAHASAGEAVTAASQADEATSKPAAGASTDPAADAVTDPAADADGAVAESTPSAPYVPVATSTTSLIFHAPVLPALPPRPERYDTPDFSDDEQPTGRRRTRRRSGSPSQQEQAPAPRTRPEPERINEPQRVKGSTRLEAKKQRRRDGRDAGRRRQVITEDEFLARRESVDRAMIVRSSPSRIEIGVLEDNVLAEHYITKSHNVSLIGNVYLGKVQNVLPSMEAAFVDIGRGRNAVLYSGEVDWDAADTGNQPRRIELALKPGDKVLVQVTKDPVGHKGARLTSQISLPGRYLVYVPNGSMNGISRKLPDTERARLKKILKEILPEHAGVIVRTAAEGATEEQLQRDVSRLTSQWEAIQKKVQSGQAPVLLHSEPDLLIKIVRDVFNEDFSKLVIDGEAARATIDEYLSAVAPDLKDRVAIYDGPDSFEEFRINEQVEKALDRKVWLPSGGSLVIDRTEAMTVIDVNTGKFVGSGGNLEETVTKNNLEAAEEIVRQLRLRDIGGIIVVDFIDMVLETNRDLVLRRLVECLSRDRTKHQVAEVTSLGLVQMTRKKIGVGLQESINELAGKGVEQQDAAQRSGRSRKPRGGNGNGGSANGGGASHAHQITDDVKNALSRIAASTVVHHADAPTSATSVEPGDVDDVAPLATPPASADLEAADNADEPTADRNGASSGRSGRRRSRRASRTTVALPTASPDTTPAQTSDVDAGAPRLQTPDDPNGSAASGDPAQPVAGFRAEAGDRGPSAVQSGASEAEHAPHEERGTASASAGSRRVSTSAPVAAEGPVAILDLPIAATKRVAPRVSSEAAESLLDSVLQALPEPKQPGQGRNRSRRVSSGTVVTPTSRDGAGEDGLIVDGTE
ncbi:Rne/Rng family ribonuclease [Curtobacterium ammoniigenes]|uniref:Rne/Rng family ribonuclease n=1 Tax=Curtobacterium ammoniigenes TaxID=395387 RepID=UPI000A90E89C